MTLEHVQIYCVWGEGRQETGKSQADKEVPERGKEHDTFCTVGNQWNNVHVN